MAQLKNCHLALTSSLCIGYDQYVMDHGSPVRHTSYASQVNFYLQHQSQPPVSLFEMKFQRYRNVLAMELYPVDGTTCMEYYFPYSRKAT